jgi:hypothetical protein
MFGGEMIKADCRSCLVKDPRERASRRVAFGCDAPAPRPVWRVACSCCSGPDDTPHPECGECGGTGSREFHRCPGSMINTRLDVHAFMRAWAAWESRHALPVEGALFDQTAHFVDACGIMDGERAQWDERKDERRKREAQQRSNAQAGQR